MFVPLYRSGISKLPFITMLRPGSPAAHGVEVATHDNTMPAIFERRSGVMFNPQYGRVVTQQYPHTNLTVPPDVTDCLPLHPNVFVRETGWNELTHACYLGYGDEPRELTRKPYNCILIADRTFKTRLH